MFQEFNYDAIKAFIVVHLLAYFAVVGAIVNLGWLYRLFLFLFNGG